MAWEYLNEGNEDLCTTGNRWWLRDDGLVVRVARARGDRLRRIYYINAKDPELTLYHTERQAEAHALPWDQLS